MPILVPVDDELIHWGRKCGMPIPDSLTPSRYPTLDEVRKAVENLDGYSMPEERPGLKDGEIDIDVRSIENKEFTLESDPVFGEFYGKKVFSCPTSDTTLWIKHLQDGNVTSLSFHKGDAMLAVFITQRLTRYCGTLALINEINGFPLFVTPQTACPEGVQMWIES